MKRCKTLSKILKIIKSKNGRLFSLLTLIVFGLLCNNHAVRYNYILDHDIIAHLVPSMEPNADSCPILPDLDTKMEIAVPVMEYNETTYALHYNVRPGGMWQPDNCRCVHDVAVIVPYRNRPEQLKAFLHHMHPFLQKQLLNYGIFIIEQSFKKPFNRGKLLNIGFLEALKIHKYHCVIFHDVDLLPLVEYNIYACTDQPRHLSASIDSWRFNLKYETAFGGAIAMLAEHFVKCNGFSNLYFGWGGEDDDFIERIIVNNLNYCRFSPEVSRYHMLPHRYEVKNPERDNILSSAKERWNKDGLNSMEYKVLKFEKKPLYTHFIVDV